MNKESKIRQIEKIEVVNDIDKLFYDIENIEDQATVFRLVLRQLNNSTLIALKTFIENDLNTLKDLKGGNNGTNAS
jgi:hypothetical protein